MTVILNICNRQKVTCCW